MARCEPNRATLVVGGHGFIGTHAIAILAAAGHSVSVLDVAPPSHVPQREVSWIQGEITSRRLVRRALRGVDVVVNLAGASPTHVGDEAAWAVNQNGAAIVAQEAAKAGVLRLVHISSDAVYGRRVDSGLASEGRTPMPFDVYGRSKLAGETAVRALIASGELRGLVLRPFAVIGAGQGVRSSGTALVPAAIHAARTRQPIRIIGDGEQVRDFVSVKDVARAIHAAIDAEMTTDHPINVGTGVETSVNTVVDLVEQVCGERIQRHYIDSARSASGWRADLTWAEAMLPCAGLQPIEEAIGNAWHGLI